MIVLRRWALPLAIFGASLVGTGCPAPCPSPVTTPQLDASATATKAKLGSDLSPECRQEVLGLQQWLRSIEDAGLPLAMSLLDEGASLVKREGPPIEEAAPLVHLTKDEAYLDGIPVADPKGLGDELTALIALRKDMMPESPFIKSPHCHLAVSGQVAWSRVQQTVAAMSQAGVERVTFLFSDPHRTLPAPPQSPIDAELDRMMKSAPVRRGQIIAELMAYVYQDCPQGLRVIANMGLNPIADFKQAILDALPEAIGKCGCAPEEASVKALHWALFGNPRPSSGLTVRIASKESPAVVTIAAPPAQPWSQTHEKIASASADLTEQPVGFEVTEAPKSDGKPPAKPLPSP